LAVFVGGFVIANLETRTHDRSTVSRDTIIKVHDVGLENVSSDDPQLLQIITYVVLSRVYMESNGVGILRRKRRVGNVVSDLDLGDDTALTDVHGCNVGELRVLVADAAIVLNSASTVGRGDKRSSKVLIRSQVHGEPLVRVGKIQLAGTTLGLRDQGWCDKEVVSNHVLAASEPLVLTC
jgi:carbonic anhydrase/acetyltransferase-like protein (isoleucine patch superfamily)